MRICEFLEPGELLNIALLNRLFSNVIFSHPAWRRWCSLFPAKKRSIEMSWADIKQMHDAASRVPIDSESQISDYPRRPEDYDCPTNFGMAADLFFRGEKSKHVIQSVVSRVRGYHRTLWRCSLFGDRLARIWRIPWDKPYSACEHRVLKYPDGVISPPVYPTWGDWVMWTERLDQQLTPVNIKGLTMFVRAQVPRKKESLWGRVTRLLKRYSRHHRWYAVDPRAQVDPASTDWEVPFIPLDATTRESMQLRLYNIFNNKEHTIPLSRFYEESTCLDCDEPLCHFQDVVETTMFSEFFLFLQIHGSGKTLLTVWDLEQNCAKWKDIADGAVVDEDLMLVRLRFGNALLGYLTRDEDYIYVLRDLSTGKFVQSFPMDDYGDPTASRLFDCSFTSFFFIAWCPDLIWQRGRNNLTTESKFSAPFDIYSIQSGQKLYTLSVPMYFPEIFSIRLSFPILPHFQRTDESERFWIFRAPLLFHENTDITNAVLVWDVVEQEWTILCSLCFEEDMCTMIYEENGRMKMANVNLDMPNPFADEEGKLSEFRWRATPGVKDAVKLKIPPLKSVLNSPGGRW
jgi:hypothetical protein